MPPSLEPVAAGAEAAAAGPTRRRRIAWSIVDQALSSLTNFSIGIIVARESSARGFGAFGIAFTTYLLAMGVSRALCTDALVIRFSADGTYGRWGATRDATGAALALSAVSAGACAVAAITLGGDLRAPLLVLALALPGMMLQDAYRFSFFALGTPRKAAANDLAWAIGQLVAFGAVFAWAEPTPTNLIACWGGSATVAALLAPVQGGVVPRPSHAANWIRLHLDLGGLYLVDFLAVLGSVQITVYGLGVVEGLREAGSLRAAWLLLGPLNSLYAATLIAAVPEGVRISAGTGEDVRRMCRFLAVVLTGIALGWVTVLTLMPDPLGTSILGDSWVGAERILLVLGLALSAVGVVFAADTGLRALANAKRGLRARLTMLPLTILGGLGGAIVAGEMGAVSGLLAANCIGSGLFWFQFSRAASEHAARPSAPVTP